MLKESAWTRDSTICAKKSRAKSKKHDKLKVQIRYFLCDQRGNVESSLVVIPLIFLFLASMQVIVAINFKNIDHALVQSEATQQAISGEVDEDATIHRIDIYNDIRLLVIKRVREIPQLIPGLPQLLGRNPEINMSGVSIIEETR